MMRKTWMHSSFLECAPCARGVLDGSLFCRLYAQRVLHVRVGYWDWSGVISQCKDYIDDIARDGYTDNDNKQYIFEAAVVAVFGPDVWKWVNDKAR